MAQRLVLTVLAALLLLGAGCQSTTPEPPTVTPAPVPTVSDTVDTRNIPADHRAALEGRSFRTTVTFELRYPDGSTGRLTDEFDVGSDDSYRYERQRVGRYPGGPDNVTIWQTGSAEFVRQPGDNESAVVQSGTSTGLEDPTLSGFLTQILRGFELDVQQTTSGQNLEDKQASVRTLPLPPRVHNARNVTLGMAIRDNVVRALIINGVADLGADDERVAIRIVFTVDGINEREPTRPPWASTEQPDG